MALLSDDAVPLADWLEGLAREWQEMSDHFSGAATMEMIETDKGEVAGIAELHRVLAAALRALKAEVAGHGEDCLSQHETWRKSGIDVHCQPCEVLAQADKLRAAHGEPDRAVLAGARKERE